MQTEQVKLRSAYIEKEELEFYTSSTLDKRERLYDLNPFTDGGDLMYRRSGEAHRHVKYRTAIVSESVTDDNIIVL